jgi:RimJ/RimL family protein N-acetyltransferase
MDALPPDPHLVLRCRLLRLEPIQPAHAEPLARHGIDPDLWALTQQRIETRGELDSWVNEALAARAAGDAVPYAIVLNGDDTVIGSTRFAAIDTRNRRLEIGWSWIGRPWHGSHCNYAAKYLLLQYAFETLGMSRVEFKANAANLRSRRALAKLGAREEGVFRKWRIGPDGQPRDTAWFSILDDEWLAVKKALADRLAGSL